MNLYQNQSSGPAPFGFSPILSLPSVQPATPLFSQSDILPANSGRIPALRRPRPSSTQTSAIKTSAIQNLGLLQGSLQRSSVIPKGRERRYRFSLDRSTSLALTLSGRTVNARLQLTNAGGRSLRILNARQGRRSAQELGLSPGTYFLRLRGLVNRPTSFRLEMTGNTAGVDLPTAVDLGNLTTAQTLADFVGNYPSGAFVNNEDYFRFQLASASQVSLTGLSFSQTPYLELSQDINQNGRIDLDGGEVLNTSFNWLTTTEGISQTLAAGTYYLRISANPSQGAQGISTNYRFNLQTTPLLTPSGYSNAFGFGLLDASAAVAAAIGRRPFTDFDFFTDFGFPNYDQINLAGAAREGRYTGAGITVAVIDTGIDYNDIDLDEAAWINNDEVDRNGFDDDRNGFVDDRLGWNFVANDPGSGGVSNNPLDVDGHGTAVAKIIYDIAPNARIMPVKVFPSFVEKGILYDTLQSSYIAAGIIYATNNGADVINLSLSGSYSKAVEDAIQYATGRGSVVVMATGNNGATAPTYPAGLADRYGIAVGAVDQTLKVADFSNRAGIPTAYVVAPGVNVNSVELGQILLQPFSGTSFAAPHVAGVVALMLEANPFLSPAQVRSLITQTANRQQVRA